MELWTLQHADAYKKLLRDGCLCANEETLCFMPEDGVAYDAYLWMVEQLRNKAPSPAADVRFPMWAWAKYGKPSGKPDMRRRAHAARGTPLVRLRIDVPEQDLLLSDFSLWHYVLNYWYLPEDETDADEFNRILDESDIMVTDLNDFKKTDAPLPLLREMIESSWTRIFDIEKEDKGFLYGANDEKYIQAVFWRLSLDHILSAEPFIAK